MKLLCLHFSAGYCGHQERYSFCASLNVKARQTECSGPRIERRTTENPTRVHTTADDVNSPRSSADDASFLMQQCGAVGSAIAGEGEHGLGLFITREVSRGDTLMRVPESVCLIVDHERGMHLPDQPWPRLRKGLQREEALPWDILLVYSTSHWDPFPGLALLDALNGDGGAFWEEYAGRLLPLPASLSVPFCLQPSLLRELQHQDIIDGAEKQQGRLAALFPGLAIPMDSDSRTTFMQWGLACVRSRAFQLGKDRFAFVPFLDIANHAPEPNAAFRVSGSADAIELVALADIDAGQEAVISYTGHSGSTNIRMMQQYGFVMLGGNPADRVILPSAQAAASSGPALSIQHMESILGDQMFVDMMGGRQPRLVAALKSLPLRDDDAPAHSSPAERDLVDCLTYECSNQLYGCGTSIEEDVAASEAAKAGKNGRLQKVLRYRMERKSLLQTIQKLLMLYSGQACDGN